MSVLGAPVLLSALQSVDYSGADNGSRTLVGVAAVLLAIGVAVVIGQMMTGRSKS
jgi:hypothetical protein